MVWEVASPHEAGGGIPFPTQKSPPSPLLPLPAGGGGTHAGKAPAAAGPGAPWARSLVEVATCITEQKEPGQAGGMEQGCLQGLGGLVHHQTHVGSPWEEGTTLATGPQRSASLGSDALSTV